MALVWREQMSIGHPAVDDDHRYLLEVISEFLALVERNNRHSDFDEIFRKLAYYTKLHFEREERLQLTAHYPGYREHKIAHAQLLVKLQNLHKRFSGEPNPAVRLRLIPELNQFLRSWLVDHILEEDRKLRPSLAGFVMKDPLPLSPREVAAKTANPPSPPPAPPPSPAPRPSPPEPESMVYGLNKDRQETVVEFYSTETGIQPADKTETPPRPTPAPGPQAPAVPARPPSSEEKLDIGMPELPAPARQYLDDTPTPQPRAGKRHSEDAWRAELEAELAKSKQDKAGAPPPDIPRIIEEHGKWLASGGKEGERANLEGLDLSGADLSGARLSNANLRNASFAGADCRQSAFDGADMRFSDVSNGLFAGANLATARLRHADLSFCDFAEANLRGADLSGARLKGARFPDADLAGAVLLEVDLEDADLSSARGLIQGQVKKARTNAGTRMPPGMRLGGTIETAGISEEESPTE